MLRKTIGSIGGSGLLAVVLHAGWLGAVLLVLLAVLIAAVFCWVVVDVDRPNRAALLLRAWRQTSRDALFNEELHGLNRDIKAAVSERSAR
jgi:Flp pilus assembly protein TadB